MPGSESNGVEAMQVDLADDQNDNNVDVIAGGGGGNVAEDFIVENPTMVRTEELRLISTLLIVDTFINVNLF